MIPGGAVQAWAAAARARAEATKSAQPDKVPGKHGWHLEKCCEKKGHSVWYLMHNSNVVEVHHDEITAEASVKDKQLYAAPPPGLYEKPPSRDAQRQYGENRG